MTEATAALPHVRAIRLWLVAIAALMRISERAMASGTLRSRT